MKYLVVCLLLSGCANITVHSPSGWDVTYNIFGRKITDVEIQAGEYKVNVGSASSEVDAKAVACILAPELCQ